MEESWKDLKEDLNKEPSRMTTYRLHVATVFREFGVPFHMWQHNRSFTEAVLKEKFEEDTGVLPQNIRDEKRFGRNNSDILITVSGFRTSFVEVPEIERLNW